MNPETDNSNGTAGAAFAAFDEPLLRRVVGKLCRTRNHWPVEELIERGLAALDNVVVLDRRLRDLPPGCRRLLALMGHARRTTWKVGRLVEMLTVLGEEDGLAPVRDLLESGILLPDLPAAAATATPGRLKDFETWVATAAAPMVQAVPLAVERALAMDHGLFERMREDLGERPPLPSPSGPQEADGLDWLLRLALLRQKIDEAPLRRTQQGILFKRDLDRLLQDPLLNAPPPDLPVAFPDPALFVVSLAMAVGLVREMEGELVAGEFPASWSGGLADCLAQTWSCLSEWSGGSALAEPVVLPEKEASLRSAEVLALLALATLPEEDWIEIDFLESWLRERHPFWTEGRSNSSSPPADAGGKRKNKKTESAQTSPLGRFLLGVAFPLRLVRWARGEDDRPAVQLTPLGRWVLRCREQPPALPAFSRTLLVQPNLEILVYRQGLYPDLIARLSRFAVWTGMGPACTLQLEAHRTYRALEEGTTLGDILRTLESHGMKEVPTTVLDSLRTWSDKRERIEIFAAGALFEFAAPADLEEALARGLPATRLTDRLAIVPSEAEIDYRHFRLTGNRDYGRPPEQCVRVEEDGVTLQVDLARADLLLETEIRAFAEAIPTGAVPGHRGYRLTPTTLGQARQHGWQAAGLENWFRQRTGLPMPSAARLLLTGMEAPPLEVRRRLVLQVPDEELTDGLLQWPRTRRLLEERLGPTSVALAEQDLEEFRACCAELGIRLFHGEG